METPTSAVATFTDPRLLELVDEAEVVLPRGEPRRRVAELARALIARETGGTLHEKLGVAAEALWDDGVRRRLARAAERHSGALELLDRPARENPLAHAVAYRAALPMLASDDTVTSRVAQLEPALADLDADERASFATVLAGAAVPALGVDVEQLKDEGYRYVATYPPEGSEGVDIIGKAAGWLSRRMTLDGDAPRLAMRRFLAVLAEQAELDQPTVAAALDRLLAAPMPDSPTQDRLFLALARGLVEEAVDELGFPF